MCREGEKSVIQRESYKFRLCTPKNRLALTRLYLGTEYIGLTPLDLHYLSRLFNIMDQQLGDYVFALPELLSYVRCL